jgi:hypothetical protein
MATDNNRPDRIRSTPQGAGAAQAVSHWDGRADVSVNRHTGNPAEGGEPIRWWNDGELPLVGRGVDGLIYVVSTFLPPGSSVSSVGCVRGPSLSEVLAVFGRGVCQSVTPAFWVSRDDCPGRSLRQDVIAHKGRAEEAAARSAWDH